MKAKLKCHYDHKSVVINKMPGVARLMKIETVESSDLKLSKEQLILSFLIKKSCLLELDT